MTKKESKQSQSRFDSLFGAVKTEKAAKYKVTDTQTSEHSDVKLSKSKDPDYQRTTIYIPKALHKKLKAAALEEEREISDIVEELIQDWLDIRTSE